MKNQRQYGALAGLTAAIVWKGVGISDYGDSTSIHFDSLTLIAAFVLGCIVQLGVNRIAKKRPDLDHLFWSLSFDPMRAGLVTGVLFVLFTTLAFPNEPKPVVVIIHLIGMVGGMVIAGAFCLGNGITLLLQARGQISRPAQGTVTASFVPKPSIAR